MDSHSESTRAFCLKSSACLPGTSKAVDKLESPPTLAIGAGTQRVASAKLGA